MSAAAAYLVLQLTGRDRPAADALFDELAAAAGSAVLARCAATELLETGSPEAAVLLASWATPEALQRFWDETGAAAFARHLPRPTANTFAAAVPAVPPAGDPDDPTLPHAGNSPAVDTPGPGLMLVQGVVTDPAAIGRYRDLIRPLLRANHGYYLVYCFADAVT
ncbi:MAG: hypothetical protein KJO38_01145, partial [Gammaproteobacteria bacterium]|nr:hypothetical protein [Gammaproteobacteria bacterium]